jgi:hypothetical protein
LLAVQTCDDDVRLLAEDFIARHNLVGRARMISQFRENNFAARHCDQFTHPANNALLRATNGSRDAWVQTMKSFSFLAKFATSPLRIPLDSRHKSSCSTLDHGWRRFPAEWGDQHLSEQFKGQAAVQVVMVIYPHTGNSSKMTNDKW